MKRYKPYWNLKYIIYWCFHCEMSVPCKLNVFLLSLLIIKPWYNGQIIICFRRKPHSKQIKLHITQFRSVWISFKVAVTRSWVPGHIIISFIKKSLSCMLGILRLYGQVYCFGGNSDRSIIIQQNSIYIFGLIILHNANTTAHTILLSIIHFIYFA